MNVKNLFLILGSSLILSACSWNTKPVEIRTVKEEKLPLNIPLPGNVKLLPAEWFVITPENADSIFAELEKRSMSLVIIGVTDEGYENLSMNNKKKMILLMKQHDIIMEYKKYYEGNDNGKGEKEKDKKTQE